ncbi:hypothetical protein GCM10012319_56480 [Comamonas sp. KCTC 72670]|nr:hypothetical protein GCM10012319_56480 [Comamonas sp. KCTC 72670]
MWTQASCAHTGTPRKGEADVLGTSAEATTSLTQGEDVHFESAFKRDGPIKPWGALTLWVGGRYRRFRLLARKRFGGAFPGTQ